MFPRRSARRRPVARPPSVPLPRSLAFAVGSRLTIPSSDVTPMRPPKTVRALGWRLGRRVVDWSAAKLKLASYVPVYDYRLQLDAHTSFVEDRRPVRDKRAATATEPGDDLTITLEGLEDVLAGRSWSGRRMLE